ncbi:hypothetical protein MA16_Dca006229 [Dendrobium catenatum]|uniref:Uncharacterized protein n=1 Tax=Dendrobium catenatum TaxID=906689 RepID=A0A2I0W989_9ASPA|nr:hypothetical protein MA16_Dca006229 [Dendrobium catenatum]
MSQPNKPMLEQQKPFQLISTTRIKGTDYSPGVGFPIQQQKGKSTASLIPIARFSLHNIFNKQRECI